MHEGKNTALGGLQNGPEYAARLARGRSRDGRTKRTLDAFGARLPDAVQAFSDAGAHQRRAREEDAKR